MAVSTVTFHPTVTVYASLSSSILTSPTSILDDPKESGLYPNGRGYGIAVWFGIGSAILAAALIVAYMGWLSYKAIQMTRQQRFVTFFSFGLGYTVIYPFY